MNARKLARTFGAALALVVTMGTVAAPAQLALADGAWLDAPAPLQNWNTPGQPVPPPAEAVNRAESESRCARSIRSAETLEDAQVEKQGWLLTGTYTGGWSARVVQGATSFDGMCRPLGYQMFVFYHSVFAGTLSPMVMNARTDGALNAVFLSGPDAPSGPVGISARFARYKDSDPLCCPSAMSMLSLQIVPEGGKPLVTPMQVFTQPTTQG